VIAAAFWDAERQYRERLQAISLAAMAAAVAARTTPAEAARFFDWLRKTG
jgi:hypothetical protein